MPMSILGEIIMDFIYDKAKKNENYFGDNVHIEPFVQIGKGNVFGDNCVIKNGTIIGDNNYFAPGVVIGVGSRERIKACPINKIMTDEPKVIIGNNNCLETYSVVQTAVTSKTTISENVCIGPFSFIGHDVDLNSNSIIAGQCAIAGYSIIMEGVNLGIGSMIHQRTVVGAYAMVGAGCAVVNHILPAATVAGVPARFLHVNRLGLLRAGYSNNDIDEIEYWLNNEEERENVPLSIISFYNEFNKAVKIWERNIVVIPQ